MDHWTVTEWIQLVTAVGTTITVVVASVGAILANLARIKGASNERKIDHNTEITVKGTTESANIAKTAANTAAETKKATEDMAKDVSKKLNGGLDSAISAGVEPLHTALNTHMEQDKNDLNEVKSKLDEMTNYVHLRNHDTLNVLNQLNLKVEVIVKMIEKGKLL